MSVTDLKHFNLPWHQSEHYWILLYPKQGSFPAALMEAMEKVGMKRLDDEGFGVQTGRDWKTTWDKLYAAIEKTQSSAQTDVVVAPGEILPVAPDRKTVAAVQSVAQSLWLGEALLEGRIVCYLQPVVSAKDKVFGYESFARVKDGSNIIGGDKIVAASKVLGIEHMIDRHLQVQAIKTFISSEFNGFLFVNFFPGFIHRPSVYLEGLSETAKSFGIISKHIVLDFTKSETPRDMAHLKSVCEYGRSRGYSIALDDVESVESARKLIADIHPDFVKIDMQLVRRVMEPDARDTIRQIVELVHAVGGTVIGEGVESEDIHQALRSLSVDLFQGYHFSPPVPVEAALKKASKKA